MDLMSRGLHPNRSNQPVGPEGTPTQQPIQNAPQQSGHNPNNGRVGKMSSPIVRYASIALLFSITILLLALAASFAFGSKGGEGNLVKDDLMQVVVLNNDQQPPYFGKVTKITKDYVVLTDVWYLLSEQQVQPAEGAQGGNLEVRKLGCEIHGPTDQMVINRAEVLYWENLKEDGRIPKEIAAYKESNPDYAKCTDTPAADAGADATEGAEPAATPPAATPPAGNTRR